MIETVFSTDHLIGLWNRRYLDKTLKVDLDWFRAVNYTSGHEAGDPVIREEACRIRKACGPDALVARVGRDEFVALVPERVVL